MATAAYLAACGEGGGELQSKPIQRGPISRSLDFASWPRYVGRRSTIEAALRGFHRTYGTTVAYLPEIVDNERFFRSVRQEYALGKSGGRDLQVVGDWMAARMKRLGFARKLDQAQLPHLRRTLIEPPSRPGLDRDRDYSVPWQSGQTGIVYRKDKVRRPPTSVDDLFDPAYRGKVTMLTEMRDTVGLVMLGLGENPETFSGVDPALTAIHKLAHAARSGQIRRFTSEQYRRELLSGRSWLAVGWSGDALQLASLDPSIAFSQPEEGFMLWTDDMQVPVGAPHAFTAEKLIDFVYRPEVQAAITRSVMYMPPVKGVQALVAKHDPKLAHNPLVFPSEHDLKRGKAFRELKPEEERQLDAAFRKLLTPSPRRRRREAAWRL